MLPGCFNFGISEKILMECDCTGSGIIRWPLAYLFCHLDMCSFICLEVLGGHTRILQQFTLWRTDKQEIVNQVTCSETVFAPFLACMINVCGSRLRHATQLAQTLWFQISHFLPHKIWAFCFYIYPEIFPLQPFLPCFEFGSTQCRSKVTHSWIFYHGHVGPNSISAGNSKFGTFNLDWSWVNL